MPSNWPQQALDAQAVAARTYAITSRPVGATFDVYDNTRSQMYEGVKAETAASNAAVAATSGQVVEYDGNPVETYFFASSGGQTESVQNVFQIAPEAWLVGRPDPYDDSLNNPYHRWKMSFSLNAASAKLGRLVEGSLEGIKVLQRGVSPRIVKAQVVGTKGAVTVTGHAAAQAPRDAEHVDQVHNRQRPWRADEHDAGCHDHASGDHHADRHRNDDHLARPRSQPVAVASRWSRPSRSCDRSSRCWTTSPRSSGSPASNSHWLRGQRHDLPRGSAARGSPCSPVAAPAGPRWPAVP